MRAEAPPNLWEAATEDTVFLPLLGELIAAALRPGSSLAELTLAANNIVGPPDPAVEVGHPGPPSGEHVAITIRGPGVWTSDWTWHPDAPFPDRLPVPGHRLAASRASFAYGRRLATECSVTVFLPRLCNG